MSLESGLLLHSVCGAFVVHPRSRWEMNLASTSACDFVMFCFCFQCVKLVVDGYKKILFGQNVSLALLFLL